MFELLEATDDEVVAIRLHGGSLEGYRALYELLVEKTDAYGTVHLYEETTNWTLSTYLSHYHGLLPDLRYGPKFDIDRHAAVGDSALAKLLHYQWRAVAPVFPVSPAEMRYDELSARGDALEWVKMGTDDSDR
ncbi:STAS/SEC14 domain-containing protein [Natrarchaeobius sp. A-rgal3]|uniref:STAS/SEC14 domain-containing protein n=1 Tax=Natrarchaeobius versutus TaxID=1679078 RepID=UPI0035100E6C